MTLPAYHRDAYLRSLETSVVERGRDGDRAYVVLADTVLYPEGGGQPADHGTVGAVPVLDVQRKGGVVRHYVAGPVDESNPTVVLDWEHRFDAMQQHSGQHLLSAIAEDRFGWRTTAFHLGPELCDIELDTPSIEETQRQALEGAVAAAVREARPLRSRFVSPQELPALAVRSRGLPDGHRGEVRLVEIEGLDLNTCGGTHVRSTAELESVTLLGHEPMRGGTRLHFVVGGRVRARLVAAERLHQEFRRRLGVPDSGLCDALDRRAEELRTLGRRLEFLESERARQVVDHVRSLLAAGERLAHVHLEEADGEFLRRLGRPLRELETLDAAFVSATDAKGSGSFLLVVRESRAARSREALTAILEAIEGRGGGVGAVLQGRAGDLRPQARERATSALSQWLAGDLP